jgi:hypothetical protein
MEVFRIEILNPKAKVILKSLADLKLISMKKERQKKEIKSVLSNLRKYPELAPSEEDSVNEVEEVRKTRHGK